MKGEPVRVLRGRNGWRLPISHRSALAIAEFLLDSSARSMQPILEKDPPFALWILLQAAAAGDSELRTAGSLADWLSSRATELFSNEEPAAEDPSADFPVEPARCAQWAAESIAVAELSRRLAEEDSIRDEAYLVGLLHHTRDWLSHAALDSQDAPAPPSWLEDQLSRTEQTGDNDQDAVSEIVRRAVSVIQGEQPAPEGFFILHGDRKAFLADLAANWSRPCSPGPEFWRLAAAQAAERRELSDLLEKRLEEEKIASLAEFAAGAGHEINNPVANIAGRAQILLQGESDPQRRRDLATINRQAMRVHEMIADVMLFARMPQPDLRPVDVRGLVEEIGRAMNPRAAQANARLTVADQQDQLMVLADAAQLQVAIRALIDNALEAVGTSGRVELQVKLAEHDRDMVEICVCDDGPGIPDAVRRHAFDPYFSGRQAGRGLGVGLSKCWRIVRGHQGRMEIENDPNQGARARVLLPCLAEAAESSLSDCG
ncbi:MAG: ATP-binding protein [Planctomycetales bacterium]